MNRCFISYESHPDTIKFARRVKHRISSDEILSKYLDPWFFLDEGIDVPHPMAWKQAVDEALFTVIVANPNYLSSAACTQELQIALEGEKQRQSQYSNAKLRTVFGICDELINVPNDLKTYIWWFKFEEELCQAIRKQLSLITPKIVNTNSYSFNDWPHKLLKKDGDLDVAIIIGSTGKEASLGDNVKEREKIFLPFKDYLTVDDETSIQSERPAEFLPYLTSSLEGLSRRNKTNLKLPYPDRTASIPEVYCDRTAIRYYPQIFKERNIITIGGGDTNFFSRYIHRAYRGQLPVHFTSPEDSMELLVETIDEGRKGTKIRILSTAENKSFFHGLLVILPNPLNPEKFIVWLAGLTALGTQAGIKILADNPDDLREGRYPYARAFKGDDDGKWRAHSYEFIN